MVVVDSMCGCAAEGPAGYRAGAQHRQARRRGHVFAGRRLRGHRPRPRLFHRLPGFVAVVAILRDGKLVYMMERRQIEYDSADAIASNRTAAFDESCADTSRF